LAHHVCALDRQEEQKSAVRTLDGQECKGARLQIKEVREHTMGNHRVRLLSAAWLLGCPGAATLWSREEALERQLWV